MSSRKSASCHSRKLKNAGWLKCKWSVAASNHCTIILQLFFFPLLQTASYCGLSAKKCRPKKIPVIWHTPILFIMLFKQISSFSRTTSAPRYPAPYWLGFERTTTYFFLLLISSPSQRNCMHPLDRRLPPPLLPDRSVKKNTKFTHTTHTSPAEKKGMLGQLNRYTETRFLKENYNTAMHIYAMT